MSFKISFKLFFVFLYLVFHFFQNFPFSKFSVMEMFFFENVFSKIFLAQGGNWPKAVSVPQGGEWSRAASGPQGGEWPRAASGPGWRMAQGGKCPRAANDQGRRVAQGGEWMPLIHCT